MATPAAISSRPGLRAIRRPPRPTWRQASSRKPTIITGRLVWSAAAETWITPAPISSRPVAHDTSRAPLVNPPLCGYVSLRMAAPICPPPERTPPAGVTLLAVRYQPRAADASDHQLALDGAPGTGAAGVAGGVDRL